MIVIPRFQNPFHIYTDASDHQLDAVIMQDKKPTGLNPQTNVIIEQVHKLVNEMVRSFDLEKENLEEYNFDYFLQSNTWTIRVFIIHHCRLHPVI
jgi:hypothetical protein